MASGQDKDCPQSYQAEAEVKELGGAGPTKEQRQGVEHLQGSRKLRVVIIPQRDDAPCFHPLFGHGQMLGQAVPVQPGGRGQSQWQSCQDKK